ncbi:hypothetical protein Drorol1_Dr00017878 [Drosera rotundifolia]
MITTVCDRCLFILCFVLVFSGSMADDASVMKKLRDSLTSAPSGWSDQNPCEWTGVQCERSRVTAIDLAHKNVSGTLPQEMSSLSNLVQLSIQGNTISGPIPTFKMSSLQRVYLDGNNFTSGVLSFFNEQLTNLQTLSIGDNPFDPWVIPDSLSGLGSLQNFSADNANINGEIPDVFGSLPGLMNLRLSYNNITGSLPASFAASLIQNLWINNQQSGVTGSLYVLGHMPSLSQAWVHDNEFTGVIPDLSKCGHLFDLQLRENQLTGVVPTSLMNLPGLINVSLQNNLLQGPMPVFKSGVSYTLGTNCFCRTTPGPCDPQVSVLLEIAAALGYPRELAESWMGNDACNGWPHVTCDVRGENVTVVNFGKQGWRGTISPAFADLTSLTKLILDDNKLYGTIPDGLAGLPQLHLLDVSNNNLTGQIPKFSSIVVLKKDGNPFLGTDVPTGPSPSPGSPPSPGTPPTPSKLSPKNQLFVKMGIILVSLVIAGALIYMIYKIVLRKMQQEKYGQGKWPIKGMWKDMWNAKVDIKKRNKIGVLGGKSGKSSKEFSDSSPFTDGGNAVYPIEVLRQVTNNFSENNILGSGGFGVVYEGNINGTLIAVKRMVSNDRHSKGMSEFEAEIKVLSKVRHRHLVALLGYSAHANEKIVVYEYMPQGTLAQHLFEWRQMGLSPLSWKQRLVIALDVARGVEYLHSLAHQSFIHRDLKPSNILLGDDMRAKVSDFGLVKTATEGKHTMATHLAGTFGYLAPEYATSGRVSTKCDVYSFGVVLMELITGRKALDESLGEDQAQLVQWFRRVIITRENLRKSIDPCLDVDEEMYQVICKVADLSGHCTAREPYQRPDMSHAVTILQPLVVQWSPSRFDDDDPEYAPEDELYVNLPNVVNQWRAGETTTADSFLDSLAPSSAPTTPSIFNEAPKYRDKR